MDARQQVMQVIGHAALLHNPGTKEYDYPLFANAQDATDFINEVHNVFKNNYHPRIARGLGWTTVAKVVRRAAYGYTAYSGRAQAQSDAERKVAAYRYIPSDHGDAMKYAHAVLRMITMNIDDNESVFYDIGCGIGDKLLLGYAAGFDRAVGVEMNEGTTYVAACVLNETHGLPIDIMNLNAFDLPCVDDNSMIYTYMPIMNSDILEKLYEHIFSLMAKAKNVIHHECDIGSNTAYLRALGTLLKSGKAIKSHLPDDYSFRAYVECMYDGTMRVNMQSYMQDWIDEMMEDES